MLAYRRRWDKRALTVGEGVNVELLFGVMELIATRGFLEVECLGDVTQSWQGNLLSVK